MGFLGAASSHPRAKVYNASEHGHETGKGPVELIWARGCNQGVGRKDAGRIPVVVLKNFGRNFGSKKCKRRHVLCYVRSTEDNAYLRGRGL